MSLWNAVAWGQQTAAARALAAQSGRRGGLRSARKRRRKAKTSSSSSSPRRRRARARTRGRARLVKGSAAAKRYMTKIRRMRKRK